MRLIQVCSDLPSQRHYGRSSVFVSLESQSTLSSPHFKDFKNIINGFDENLYNFSIYWLELAAVQGYLTFFSKVI